MVRTRRSSCVSSSERASYSLRLPTATWRTLLHRHASRRTRKLNAYVSGLGRTRRLVLFDTLLGEADRQEVQLVVAHELGHRRARHEYNDKREGIERSHTKHGTRSVRDAVLAGGRQIGRGEE